MRSTRRTSEDELEAPWSAAFELAWESWCAGSLGIGAVVTDGAGSITGGGRNRVYETSSPPGRMAGTFIAHAEVDALAALAPGRYADHVLFTTLEPCLLCWGAVRLSRVGHVRFAAPDPLWREVGDLLRGHPAATRWWPTSDGPSAGVEAALGALLPLVRHLEREGPDGVVASRYARTWPGLFRLAQETVTSGSLRAAAERGDPFADAFAHLQPSLQAVGSPDSG